MSYLTVSTIAADQSMRSRVAACAATEGETAPDNWAYTNALRWAASPGWDAAWASAEAANPGADHGANEAVITDAQIDPRQPVHHRMDGGVPGHRL